MEKEALSLQKLQEAISVKKVEGTEVDYFLYPEFEVHRNVLPPDVIQGWHTHSVVEEVIVCTKGHFIVETIVEREISIDCVEHGDVVRVKKSLHRLRNDGESAAEFVVFRFVPEGKNKQEIIKNDKQEYTEEQVQQLLSR